MNDELQKALSSKDTWRIDFFTANGSKNLNDDKFLAAQLHKNKWSLLEVVEIGNSDLTKLFIESDISMNIDCKDVASSGWTALHQAVYSFDEDHVKLLLDYNANPNILDGNSRTPLSSLYSDEDPYSDHDAALGIIKMMIVRGANAVTTHGNCNILQVENILLNGDAEVVNTIFNMMNIDAQMRYEYENTVAHYLASNGNAEFSKIMRDKEFYVNAQNDAGQTPLFCAAESGHVQAVEFLLSKGADVNALNNSNCTPLWTAMKHYNLSEDWDADYLECSMILLEHGADIQLVSTNDDLPQTIFDLIFQKHKDDKLCKIILQHLALQETAGTKITLLIQTKINSNDGLKEYLEYYKILLATKVMLSETLFKLLTISEEKLIPYMRNIELNFVLFSCCDGIKSKLIYYHRLLQKRLTRAWKVGKLRESAAVVIGKLINVDYNCHPFVLDAIMRYLNCQDLNSLLSV